MGKTMVYKDIVVPEKPIRVATGSCKELEEHELNRILVYTNKGFYTLKEYYEDAGGAELVTAFKCYDAVVVVEYEWRPDRDEFTNDLNVALFIYVDVSIIQRGEGEGNG